MIPTCYRARTVTAAPVYVTALSGDPAVLIVSSEKIGPELGWKPEYADLHRILESAWKWHQQRYSRTA